MSRIARNGKRPSDPEKLKTFMESPGVWAGWTREEVWAYMDHVEQAWEVGNLPWDATTWLQRHRAASAPPEAQAIRPREKPTR